eukprot:PITA_34940
MRQVSTLKQLLQSIPEARFLKMKSLAKEASKQGHVWQCYLEWLYQHKELGLNVDVSRIGFTEQFVEEMEPKFQRAFKAMEELEVGARADITVPHFKDNDELALVQARWSFVNRDENLLTRLQNINLSFNFEAEQQVNSVFVNFFGFNGTASVWRIKALEESGGWMESTTVEDMDIVVHAHLNGWKFIFLDDVKCLCELPDSYEAYRKQQH